MDSRIEKGVERATGRIGLSRYLEHFFLIEKARKSHLRADQHNRDYQFGRELLWRFTLITHRMYDSSFDFLHLSRGNSFYIDEAYSRVRYTLKLLAVDMSIHVPKAARCTLERHLPSRLLGGNWTPSSELVVPFNVLKRLSRKIEIKRDALGAILCSLITEQMSKLGDIPRKTDNKTWLSGLILFDIAYQLRLECITPTSKNLLQAVLRLEDYIVPRPSRSMTIDEAHLWVMWNYCFPRPALDSHPQRNIRNRLRTAERMIQNPWYSLLIMHRNDCLLGLHFLFNILPALSRNKSQCPSFELPSSSRIEQAQREFLSKASHKLSKTDADFRKLFST